MFCQCSTPGLVHVPGSFCRSSQNHFEPSLFLSSLFSFHSFFFFLKVKSFIYLFLAALGLCCCAWASSSCGERRLLFVAVRGLLIAVASLVAEHGLQARGLQQLWHVGSVVVARGLQSTGSVVVAHGLSCSVACGTSRTMARTRVPCIGRRILNRCATREVPVVQFLKQNFSFKLHFKGSVALIALPQ